MYDSLDAAIFAAAEPDPERTAIGGPSGALSYSDLLDAVDRQAKLLAGYLEAPNEAVLIANGNRAVDLIATIACWRAGAVPVHAGISSIAGSVVHKQKVCGARIALVPGEEDPPWLETLNPAERVSPGLAILTREPRAVPPELTDAATVIFTSGTTAQPKGVALRHKPYLGKLAALEQLMPTERYGSTHVALSIGFNFGLWAALQALLNGGRADIIPRFIAQDLHNEIAAAERQLKFPCVPSMLYALCGCVESGEARDGRGLVVQVGGDTLTPELSRRATEALPSAQFFDVYGLTETNSADFILSTEDFSRRRGTIGRPTPGIRWRIVDSTDTAVGPGIAGELQIDTDFIMAGYVGDPAATSAAMDGRFLRTGDYAVASEDGYVSVIGRLKKLITKGGTKISPVEVESAVAAYPGVDAAVAAAVPDERFGEVVGLVIVPVPGATITLADLRDWLAQDRLERYKLPTVLAFAEDLPYGATGKVSRDEATRILTERGVRA